MLNLIHLVASKLLEEPVGWLAEAEQRHPPEAELVEWLNLRGRM